MHFRRIKKPKNVSSCCTCRLTVVNGRVLNHMHNFQVVVVVVMRSDQPKPPAIAIVRQNGLSSASCRASVAVTPMSWQIWWIQVVGGRPLARLHSCEGRSPSLVLVQIRRIWFASTSLWSLTMWPNRPSLRLWTMYVWDVEQASTTQNLVVGHEVVPADVQFSSWWIKLGARPAYVTVITEVHMIHQHCCEHSFGAPTTHH